MKALSQEQIGLIAGVLGLSVLLFVSAWRRRRAIGSSSRVYAREQLARLREEGRIKDDMEELLGRVQSVAGEMNAQLDARFQKLERLIRDADSRADRLQRLIRAADGWPVCDMTVADEGTEPGTSRLAGGPRGANPEHESVYALADAGRSALDIAQATGRNPGEIELILALRPKCRA